LNPECLSLGERRPARDAEPAEAAQAFFYLMKGGSTNGQEMVVDGGATLV